MTPSDGPDVQPLPVATELKKTQCLNQLQPAVWQRVNLNVNM